MVQASATERCRPPPRRRVERVRRTERRPARVEQPGRGYPLRLAAPPADLSSSSPWCCRFSFTLAGLQLNAYNSVLIVFIIPALLYWLPDAPRMVGLDVFMALYVLWLGVAIYHAHGSVRIVFIINQSLTLFGAYFLGRVLVRSAEELPADVPTCFWILLVLCPSPSSSSLLKRRSSAMVFGLPGAAAAAAPAASGSASAGSTSVFPHPILFGVFCSIFVANFFYVFYSSTWRRLWRMRLAMVMTFMALSSGPRPRCWSS